MGGRTKAARRMRQHPTGGSSAGPGREPVHTRARMSRPTSRHCTGRVHGVQRGVVHDTHRSIASLPLLSQFSSRRLFSPSPCWRRRPPANLPTPAAQATPSDPAPQQFFDTVTVSATLTPTAIKEVPGTVTVIDARSHRAAPGGERRGPRQVRARRLRRVEPPGHRSERLQHPRHRRQSRADAGRRRRDRGAVRLRARSTSISSRSTSTR